MEDDDIVEKYTSCVRLIHETVHEFIQRVGIPMREYEELFSQANLYFMLAVQSYDGESTKFSTWLKIQIWGRLLKQQQLERKQWHLVRHRYHQWIVDDENDRRYWEPSMQDRRFWRIDTHQSVSRDCRFLFRMVRRGNLDWEQLGKNHKTALRYVFRYLRDRGWSRVRIHRCFKNLEILLE